MNNYERQINEPAIQAHQNSDFGQLPYKLPGIKKVGEERVEQFVDRSLNRNSYQQIPSNYLVGRRALIGGSEPQLELANLSLSSAMHQIMQCSCRLRRSTLRVLNNKQMNTPRFLSY